MPTTPRKERERAERHQLIITAARELAESDGWEAVTTRRLAERVEYSQPVLYSHFRGKDAIRGAVALEGFRDLADGLSVARQTADGPGPEALRAVCRAYLEFAATRPALYQAMFVLPTDLTFASADTPEPLRAAFQEFVRALPAATARRDIVAEVTWSALHGIAVLLQGGRIPPGGQEERIDILVGRVLEPTAGGASGSARPPRRGRRS